MVQGWVRSDGEGFFPEGVGALIARLNAFPVARWNFLVIEPRTDGGDDRPFLGEVCAKLKAEFTGDYQFQCLLTTAAKQEIVAEWARDLPLRQPLQDPAEAASTMSVTLTKASMLPDPKLRAVLRADPFETYRDLLARLEAQKPMKLVLRDDFLVAPDSGRTLIPMLLAHDPLNSDATERVTAVIDEACAKAKACERIGYLGGHFATLENKTQVMKDLSSVSVTGVVCLILTLVALKLLRQLKLLNVIIPVAVGTALAAGAVVAMDGWIHGLTLSFGSGMIGLSVDYGVHAAFHSRNPDVWRSNLMGMLTTLAAIAVLAFSKIPIMRQMMIFAMFGLVFSFVILWALHRLKPAWIEVEPIRIPRYRAKWLTWVMTAVIVAGMYGLTVDNYDLGVQRLNYASKRTQELYQWFRTAAKINNLFLIRDSAGTTPVLDRLEAERSWAEAHHVRVESAAMYLPALADQEKNRAGWFGEDCRFKFAAGLPGNETKFFSPFLARGCEDVKPQSLAESAGAPPAYLQHLHGPGAWISIFFPDTPEAAAAVSQEYPDAFSLVEIAGRFPQHFKAELAWMTPASLGAIAIVLALYFRNAFMAVAAIMPFLAGVGSVVVWAWIAGEPLNFVTMIALLMLCGLSVDFGVFAVDEWRQHEDEPERTESALIVCSVASLLGVLPMVLATHPVLRSLGWPLCLGGIGSLLGSFYVVPAFLDLGARWRRRA